MGREEGGRREGGGRGWGRREGGRRVEGGEFGGWLMDVDVDEEGRKGERFWLFVIFDCVVEWKEGGKLAG